MILFVSRSGFFRNHFLAAALSLASLPASAQIVTSGSACEFFDEYARARGVNHFSFGISAACDRHASLSGIGEENDRLSAAMNLFDVYYRSIATEAGYTVSSEEAAGEGGTGPTGRTHFFMNSRLFGISNRLAEEMGVLLVLETFENGY